MRAAPGHRTAAPALEVSGLTWAAGRTPILSDISFAVDDGEFLSVVGPNGAGKTTLLRCLAGVVSHWSGTVLVRGGDHREYRRRRLARLVSYVPQGGGHWLPYTGRQLVTMGRYPHLTPFSRLSPGDLAAVEEVLGMTGTAALADRDMRTLSGGERQKLLIAGALAQEAGIMLLDEPTTFLDPRHADEILGLLGELNRGGTTVVMVTHDINAAAASSRILAMVRGRVAFRGDVEDFLDNDVLEPVYGKRFTLVAHPVSGRKMVLP